MIQSIFSFRDKVAREIMVPRIDAVCISKTAKLADLIKVIIDKGHSRIPVYEENIDNIIGILHAKDLLPYWGKDDFDWPNILRDPYFVPETKKISEILRDLRNKKSHMAVVVDEYGGTAGILTMEDIIEEIIGEIQDEYDYDDKRLVKIDDDTIVADARVDIEDVMEFFGEEIPEGKFETIGGFIISLLGRVPSVKEVIRFNDLEILIEAADNRRISRVRIKRVRKEEPVEMYSQ
ncbi:MAG TPA: HlyC/CorC family transporter [Deltaproteobacteria bacterium]|nr:MAG: HlyC/CorC family transporter [Deltaproteobacteria bacterium]RLB03088.1 MAG: HlyC/CorC family transporter [Deltaproteobacteria bacterium]HDM79510.1 HlyC/CorC family transporter [Deltaproteobacteria bacterium]